MRRRTDLLNALFADVGKAAERRRKSAGTGDKAAALRSFQRPHQCRLEADRSQLVSVRSARQVGKSTAALLIASIRCLEHAGAQWVVIGLTRPSVKRIYWGVLQGLSDAFELGIKFQHQELTATFPSGSRIYFVGAENFDEIEKLRGGRYHGAVIDECKSFSPDTFRALVEDVLGPALLGQAGQLYAIGTPGDVLQGEFYRATCDPPALMSTAAGDVWSNSPYGGPTCRHLWSLHIWTLADNDVKFRDPRTGIEFTLWEQALKLKVDRGWPDDHPAWRREYLGQWVAADGRLVYRYRPHLHDYHPAPGVTWGIPAPKASQWRTAAGFDFGTKDGTSIVIWAWSPHEPGLWEIYSEKRRVDGDLRLSVGALARWYREVEKEYGPFDGLVGDPAGLATMVIDTLAVEHGVYIEAAEKREKVDHIELFNNDLDAGLIHLLAGGELSEEMARNRWLERSLGTDRRKEDPATPNDLCDAALYAFRWCRHRQARPEHRPTAMFSAEWWQLAALEDLKAAERRAKTAAEPAELDRPWWNDRWGYDESN